MLGKIDFTVGTLGKAIGGAAGVYQRFERFHWIYASERTPYIFSNSLPLQLCPVRLPRWYIDERYIYRSTIAWKYRIFRKEIKTLGFKIIDGVHPIVPIMLGEAFIAQEMSNALLKAGVYIKGLWYPVVPNGAARLRAQISASLKKKDIDVH